MFNSLREVVPWQKGCHHLIQSTGPTLPKAPLPPKKYFQLSTFLLYMGKLMFPYVPFSPSFLPAIVQVDHSWLSYSPSLSKRCTAHLHNVWLLPPWCQLPLLQYRSLKPWHCSTRKGRVSMQMSCSHSPLDVFPAELNWKAWFRWILRKHTSQRKPYFETEV